MKIALSHLFPCTPLEFFDLLDDPAFEALQSRESDMQRDIVEQRTSPDGTRYKKVRCKPNRSVPGFIKPLLGPEGIVYFQVNEATPAQGLLRWSVEVPAFGERMQVKGTTRILPEGTGCRRIIEGDVTVNVRFIGGQIEKFVAEDVQKSYEKTARAIAAFIASRPRST